ncbi:MAG: DHH family phosphoesterase [Eubacteriales bacterium]|nr:DHH family phosphoesterase [Eubacteriales bacterium]
MTKQYYKILKDLKNSEAKKAYILPHKRADGDAIAASLGVYQILKELGKEAKILLSEELPAYLQTFSDLIVPRSEIVVYQKPGELKIEEDYLAFVVDCHSPDRLGERAEIYHGAKYLYCFDHHLSEQDLPENFWVCPERASAADMLAEVLLALAAGTYPDILPTIDLGPNLATAVLMGIYSDTGGLRYSSSGAYVYHIAGDLRERGADLELISQELFAKHSLAAQRLKAKVLTDFCLNQSGKVAWVYVDYRSRLELAAKSEDFEGLANEMLATAGVQVAILIRGLENDSLQISFRAKPPYNVQKIAALYGGGGHLQAAGLNLSPAQQREFFPGAKSVPEALIKALVEAAEAQGLG